MKDDPHVHNEQGRPGDTSASNQNSGATDNAGAQTNGHDPDAGKSTAETQKAMLKSALGYATVGFEVFPVKPDSKIPYKSARWSNGRAWGKTTNAAEIKRDFGRWPSANVGIACGPDSGFFVLDIDTLAAHGKDGFASLREMEKIYGPLPDTRKAISPTGSEHLLFEWPEDVSVKNDADLAGYPGIDVRGEGGMIVAVPSLKPGVGAYKWQNKYTIANIPAAWLELVADKTHRTERTPSDAQASVNLVAAALAVILNDASTDWEKWNRVGMATWAATGGHPQGFEAFDGWSKKNSGKYNKQKTRDKWKAYTESTPITDIGAGSIFYMASQINPDWRDEYEATLQDNLPLIQLVAEHLDADATSAEEILANANKGVFEYSGTLARPITKIVAATKDQKTMIVQLETITQMYLRRLLNRCIRFKKFNERKDKYVPCAPPNDIAEAIIDNRGNWKFDEIIGVVSTPTMHSDGSLLINPGHDKEDTQ